MLHELSTNLANNRDFSAAYPELLQSTLRNLVLATGGAFLLYCSTVPIFWTNLIIPLVFNIAPVAISICVITLWLLPKRLLAAQIFWLIGFTGIIVFTMYVFSDAEIAYFLTLVPFMAVIILGLPAGLLAEGLVIGVAWWLNRSASFAFLPTGSVLVISAGGWITGLLGWVGVYHLLTVTGWSLYYSNQANKRLEEARDNQLELKEVQEDLIHANQELARLSDQLKAMYKVAEEARRVKEEFVANVSHELRTPLNMIIGFSEMITQSPQVYGLELPAALLADIATIKRNSQHLANLVNDVLDLSQVDAGRMGLNKEWTSVQEIIETAVGAVRALFDTKGLFLETDIEANLPAVFCDGVRIRQVVLNLVSNASRFTEQGGVCIHANLLDSSITIRVSDTGPGIKSEDQKKLFEPFQQLDGSIRRRYEGSGLGLSISKRFVELHGGKMWLESEVGVGTTFFFNIPVTAPELAADVVRSHQAKQWFSEYSTYEARSRPFKAPPQKPVPRFILLERGDALLNRLRRYMHHVEITPVRDYPEAVEELKRSPAHALIVNTPVLEEVDVSINSLKELPYGTPAITCWVPGEEETAKRLGVVNYLVKPVTGDDLIKALKEIGENIENVLLVDDEQELLRLFSRMLSAARPAYHVLRATNGPRALALLRQRKPQAMVLDLIMPGMDGFQVIREKSQDPTIRDIPVIVISSMDPTGEPIITDTLTVSRGGGLTMRYLIACIQAVSEILSPSGQPVGPGLTEKPEG